MTTPGNSVSMAMSGYESITDRINWNSDSRLADHTDRVTTDLGGGGGGDSSERGMVSGSGITNQNIGPSESEL